MFPVVPMEFSYHLVKLHTLFLFILVNAILLGMLSAVAIKLECRSTSSAFREVQYPNPPCDLQVLSGKLLVQPARNPAFTCTATVLGTQTLAFRGGAAAHHGSRLLSSTAVCPARW